MEIGNKPLGDEDILEGEVVEIFAAKLWAINNNLKCCCFGKVILFLEEISRRKIKEGCHLNQRLNGGMKSCSCRDGNTSIRFF